MAPKNKSSRQSKKKRQKRVQQHVEDESDSEQGGFTGAIWDAVADGSGIIFDLVNWTIVYPIRRTTSFVADIAIATHYAAVGGLTSCFNFCKNVLYGVAAVPVNIFQRLREDPATSAKLKKKLKKLEWELTKLRKENKEQRVQMQQLRQNIPDLDNIMSQVKEQIKKSHRDLRPHLLQGVPPMMVPVLPAVAAAPPPPPPPPPPMPISKSKAEPKSDVVSRVISRPQAQQQAFVMSIDLLKNVKLRTTQPKLNVPAPTSAESSENQTAIPVPLAPIRPDSNKENEHTTTFAVPATPASAPVPRHTLRKVTIARSPGGTPLRPTNGQSRSPSNAKYFNRALSDKFRHARSPPKDSNTSQAEAAM